MYKLFKLSTMYSSINGDLIINSDARILFTDLSIQRGYGIFDFFRTASNRPLFLEDHLDRFYHSATQMHLHPGLDRDDIKASIYGLIKKNNYPDSGIKITLTGGYSEDGYTLEGKPNLLITQSAVRMNAENFDTGIRLVTYGHQRQLPEIKTIDYLKAIYLQPFIKANNADDVLYYHQDEVTECPRSNFFIVNKEDELITPVNNILKGITRKRILALTALNCKEATISLQDIREAKEAFVTSTTRRALPVLKIDGKTIGDGKPGAVTALVCQALKSQEEHLHMPVKGSGVGMQPF